MNFKRYALVACLLFFCRAGLHGWPTIYPLGLTINQEGKAFKGYTLFHSQAEKAIFMLDMKGEIAHRWDDFGGRTPMHFEVLNHGSLLVGAFDEDAGENYVIELDWDGNQTWEYKIEEEWLNQHDFQRMLNGNTLMLLATTRIIPAISEKPIKFDKFIEVTPEGERVWEWNTCEHFGEFGFSDEAKEMIANKGGDWPHSNSYRTLPANKHSSDPRFKQGNVLISQRETNILFIIDKETGEIVWQIGPDDNLTIGQHCARMIPQGIPGAGNIIVLDNGGFAGYPFKTRLYSRVVEIDPTTKEIVWSYGAKDSNLDLIAFFSAFMGGQQRLANGNTLICEAATGRIFEVTAEGEIVWEYLNPYYTTPSEEEPFPHNKIYKAYRVDEDWVPANTPGFFTDVTTMIEQPMFTWVLNPQTGTYFGELMLKNGEDERGLSLNPPFWCVLDANESRKFMNPTGLISAGRQYIDLTTSVTNLLDGESLLPGESVVIPDIEVYIQDRTLPPDSAFSIRSIPGEEPRPQS